METFILTKDHLNNNEYIGETDLADFAGHLEIEAGQLDASIKALTAYRNLLRERAHNTLQNYERQMPGLLAMAWKQSQAVVAAPHSPAEALKRSANALPLTGPHPKTADAIDLDATGLFSASARASVAA